MSSCIKTWASAIAILLVAIVVWMNQGSSAAAARHDKLQTCYRRGIAHCETVLEEMDWEEADLKSRITNLMTIRTSISKELRQLEQTQREEKKRVRGGIFDINVLLSNGYSSCIISH